MSERTALRLSPIPISKARLDRKALIIHDTVAMQIGEARGHRMMADAKTLHMMAAMGNAMSQGIKGHMGHPGMSENAFAREVMRAKNFRVVGDKLLHDVHFYDWAKKSPAFSSDPVQYIFDRAEQNPESFGESVVIYTQRFWVRTNGEELDSREHERPEDSLYDYPVMRPVEFYYVDFVTDGALTPNGLFSMGMGGEEANFWQALFAGTSSEYAERAFGLLREFQQQFSLSDEDLAHKVPALLNRYKYWKGFQVDTVEQKAPVPLEQAEGSDALSAALAEANEIAASLEAVAEDPAPSPLPEGDTVSRAEFEASQKALAESQQALASLQEQQTLFRENVAAYITKMNGAFKALSDKVAALASEPIETAPVAPTGNVRSAAAPVPPQSFVDVALPKSFDAKAQAEIVNTGSNLPTRLAEIAAIEDPAEQVKAIEAFNKATTANPFGFNFK